jgi:hypothetical protein
MSKYEITVNISSGILVDGHKRKSGPYTDRPSTENPNPKAYPEHYYPNLETVELDEKRLSKDVSFNKHIASLVRSGIAVLKDKVWENTREIDMAGKTVLVPDLDILGSTEVDKFFDNIITDPMDLKKFNIETKLPREKRQRLEVPEPILKKS